MLPQPQLKKNWSIFLQKKQVFMPGEVLKWSLDRINKILMEMKMEMLARAVSSIVTSTEQTPTNHWVSCFFFLKFKWVIKKQGC